MTAPKLNVHGLPEAEPTTWITRQQLADHVQVNVDTVDRWRKAGLPSIKTGPRLVRFDREAALDWIRSQEDS